MDKNRKQLLEKLLKEFFLAFRSMKHSHHQDDSHDGEHKDWHMGFGHGHRDLFFRLIKEKEGISVKEIASSLNVTSAAVTQMVDQLVEKEMVTREEDPNDRRSQIIKLTPKARERIESFRANMVEKFGPAFDNLDNEEVSQLTTLLGKINKQENGK
ncbi:MAG TPA: MarR family transcriptional regulator [Candidatus Saccharimonadales bacterium]|nr:MarR family transcriptional regulator [Candidatus Saccharimonadales bacterium]